VSPAPSCHRRNQRKPEAGADERLDSFQLGAAETDVGPDVAAVAKAQHLVAQAVTVLHYDEPFLVQVSRTDAALARERMAGWQCEQQFLTK